jgi:cyclic beta-1,2-glucan synthetase
MEYDFLFDEAQALLAIGYNVGEHRRDTSYYDLLASEARLACFVAIAQGQLPQESWFALGRLLTLSAGDATLLSWSGSMFEYLMPLLVMPTYDNTLLDRTYHTAVARQIAYGKERGVPWGVSESGYNGVDVQLNYQYRAFGVPGLGLKRALAEDLVVAPYASALALMVAPEAACQNLQRLAASGLAGPFGFFEAIDYTASRLPHGQASAVIRSFMAHHQGMTFLSLAYLLLDRPMQRRFASAPSFQATALLLQERIPKTTAFYAETHGEITEERASAGSLEAPMRVLDSPNTPHPEVQLLSNGRYHVMVTNAGGGYSRWNDLAVTRWREDTTRDAWGSFCYLRDLESGAVWSNTYQPTLASRIASRRSSPRAAPSSAAAITRSSAIPRSSSRRRTTSSCVGCGSPTARAPAGSSRSPATPRWCSPRPPPTPCIRPSATSSCRPRSCIHGPRSSAIADRARARSGRPGCFI